MVGASGRSFVRSSLFIVSNLVDIPQNWSRAVHYSFCSVSGGCDLQYWLCFVGYLVSWVGLCIHDDTAVFSPGLF